jgi:hypothetical protein
VPSYREGNFNRGGDVKAILRVLLAIVLAPVRLIRLIRDGEQDVRETYPDHRTTTGAEAATQGSMTLNITGLGHG